mmetsp:Transcript_42499/g.112029  ORF Transcript_42499/g.112029 Transcript_42499/m.112029 type:complete len:209 (+) Transcript_42499:130-756(+)
MGPSAGAQRAARGMANTYSKLPLLLLRRQRRQLARQPRRSRSLPGRSGGQPRGCDRAGRPTKILDFGLQRSDPLFSSGQRSSQGHEMRQGVLLQVALELTAAQPVGALGNWAGDHFLGAHGLQVVAHVPATYPLPAGLTWVQLLLALACLVLLQLPGIHALPASVAEHGPCEALGGVVLHFLTWEHVSTMHAGDGSAQASLPVLGHRA